MIDYVSNLESIAKQIGADSAAIMASNAGRQHLYCYASYNMQPEWIAIKNRLDETVPGGNAQVFRTGEAAITNGLKETLKGHYIESVLVVPIKRQGVTVATLELIHSSEGESFSETDRVQAEAFAETLERTLSI
jgi:GAF domain-containing protein